MFQRLSPTQTLELLDTTEGLTILQTRIMVSELELLSAIK